jgi:hypothetical protein
MKRLIFTITCILALASCNNSIQKHGDIPFAKFEGLNGNVAEVTTSTFGANMRRGELRTDEYPYMVCKKVYNKNGQLVEFSHKGFDEQELTSSTTTNNFYKGGKLISCREVSDFGEKKITSESKVIEDSQSKTVFEETCNGETQKGENVYDGLTVKRFANGVLFQERTYNADGIEIGYKMYNNGEFFTSISFELNEKGEPITETSIYKDEEPTVRFYEYTSYDEQGNWLTRVEYDDMKYPHSVEVREIKYR